MFQSDRISKSVEININLGCGRNIAPGWINYDVSLKMWLLRNKVLKRLLFFFKLISKNDFETKWPSNVIKRDIRKGLPHSNNSVDHIYCSHVLEHLSFEDARKVLKECHRVLKPGGCIRIVIPDLKVFAKKYLEKDSTFFRNIIKDEVRSVADAFIRALNLSDERPLIRRLLFPYSVHKWMYDFDSLKDLLLSCGFNVVEKKCFREGNFPDLEVLDNRPFESLFVEARK
jgi:SAM-dependent methyltransferase